MNQERLEIFVGVGLDDSEFISYTKVRGEKLTVQLLSWNNQKVFIHFFDPILFLDRGLYLSKQFCELKSFSPLLKEALEYTYVKIPENPPYKVYQIIDIEDEPAMEIICKRYEVMIQD